MTDKTAEKPKKSSWYDRLLNPAFIAGLAGFILWNKEAVIIMIYAGTAQEKVRALSQIRDIDGSDMSPYMFSWRFVLTVATGIVYFFLMPKIRSLHRSLMEKAQDRGITQRLKDAEKIRDECVKDAVTQDQLVELLASADTILDNISKNTWVREVLRQVNQSQNKKWYELANRYGLYNAATGINHLTHYGIVVLRTLKESSDPINLKYLEIVLKQNTKEVTVLLAALCTHELVEDVNAQSYIITRAGERSLKYLERSRTIELSFHNFCEELASIEALSDRTVELSELEARVKEKTHKILSSERIKMGLWFLKKWCGPILGGNKKRLKDWKD